MRVNIQTDADIEKLSGHQKIWWLSNKAKYGSIAAVKQVMSNGGKVGGKTTGAKGLASPKISPEKKAEIRNKAYQARLKP